MRPLYMLIALAALLVLAGGLWTVASAAMESTETMTPGKAPEKPNTITITQDNKFKPDKLKTKVGDTVTWTNNSKLTQTITNDPAMAKKKKNVEMPEGAKAFNSGPIAPGASFSYTFTTPGTYKYVNPTGEANGMTGEVVVKEKKEKDDK